MKTFHTYILALLVVATGFTSCTKETVEPTQPVVASATAGTTANPATSAKSNEFKDGIYIVFYKGNLGLHTDQDVENLSREIARSPLQTPSILNFGPQDQDWTKGIIADMTKNQARRFSEDSRVISIEADQPLEPPVMEGE